MEDAAAAAIVTKIAIIAFEFKRAWRNTIVNVTDIIRIEVSAMPARPPRAYNQENSRSESHSHAYQMPSGFEKEKRSRTGTRRLLAIHWPVLMCHPVSPSLNRVCIPPIRPKRYKIGMRKAKSVMEGS